MRQVTQERISFRWGIPELDHGSVIIPEPILRYSGRLGVKGHQFALIVHLASFRFETENGVSCPSFETIAERMGITRRYVIDLVKQMEVAGWISVRRRGTNTNEYRLDKLARECWELYKAEVVNQPSPDDALVNPSSPALVNHGSPALVNPSSPEEEETKNKKTKNKNSSSPPARSKEPPGTMKRLTEGYAARQGFRPDRWEPIQQGYRLMLDGGYSPERVEACEDRLVALGWTWTINTVRDWMPRFVAGLMPEPGSGRKSGASELMKCSQEPGDPYTELNKLGYEARVRGPGQDENIAAYNALADKLGEPRIELQEVAS